MNAKLDQILEEPIDRRNFLKKSAGAVITLRNAVGFGLFEEARVKCE